jgi:hypothetical protein
MLRSLKLVSGTPSLLLRELQPHALVLSMLVWLHAAEHFVTRVTLWSSAWRGLGCNRGLNRLCERAQTQRCWIDCTRLFDAMWPTTTRYLPRLSCKQHALSSWPYVTATLPLWALQQPLYPRGTRHGLHHRVLLQEQWVGSLHQEHHHQQQQQQHQQQHRRQGQEQQQQQQQQQQGWVGLRHLALQVQLLQAQLLPVI